MSDESRRRIRQIDIAILAVLIGGVLAIVVTTGVLSGFVNDLVGAVIVKQP